MKEEPWDTEQDDKDEKSGCEWILFIVLVVAVLWFTKWFLDRYGDLILGLIVLAIWGFFDIIHSIFKKLF